jgi:hypothetical protein
VAQPPILFFPFARTPANPAQNQRISELIA